MRKTPAHAASLLAIAVALAAPVQAADFRAEFPPQYTDTPLGVNLQTGKFRYFPYSFSMGPFQLERGFNKSGFQFLGTTFVRTLPTAGGTGMPVRTVGLGDLSMDFAGASPPNPNGYFWWSTTSVGWRLKTDNPGFTVTDPSGTTYKFTEFGSDNPPKARVTLITYADGSTISVSYDSSDRLTYLESNRGYAMRYEYLSGGAQLKVCGFNRAVIYTAHTTSCSASNYVVTITANSVVDVAGLTSTITTVGGLTQCMTLPGSSTCEFTNVYGPQPGEPTILTKANQVRQQTDANGNVYTYNYDNGPTGDDPPKYPGGPPVLSEAWMSGPGYAAHGNYEDGLLKTLEAPGGGPSFFEYDGVELKKARHLDGREITITRDYLGNAWTIVEKPKTGSSDPTVTRTQTFPIANLYANPTQCQAASEKVCDKPLTQVDARSNQTDYTYDPAHGGMLTMTLPAGANGIRPQTRYEYAQRYALVKNSSGAFVQASSPIWVKTRERFCKTTAASGQSCAGGAADEVVTDFDYGSTSGAANNLLLRGLAVTADGVTKRTCYSYDANGRKISETQPNANLTVCPGGNEPPPADPCSGVSFSVSSNAAVTEGAYSRFTISKAGTTSSSCSINYATANGSAVAPGDYTAKTTTTLTFTSAQNSQTIDVTTIDDGAIESPETFAMNLTSPSDGAVIGTGTATATINDNDIGGSPPSFSINNRADYEGIPFVFTVTKAGTTSGTFSVNYATAYGTAGSSDFTAKSGTLTFGPSDITKTITVNTTDNLVVEADENFTMNLSNATGGATISDSQGVGTIYDNDEACGGCLLSEPPPPEEE